jgi:hypothetical protein
LIFCHGLLSKGGVVTRPIRALYSSTYVSTP